MSLPAMSRALLAALVLAPLALPRPAQAAGGCRYRADDGPVRVYALPYRSARAVGTLSPGRSASGACGRVWNGAHEWTRLHRPVSGYVVSAHVRRA